MAEGSILDRDRLSEICCAYLAVAELISPGGTVKEYEGDLHMLNPNHFYYLLQVLNDELKYALGKE